MSDDEKGKPDFHTVVIPIGEDTMRQPTNLELAELIMISNSNIMAMTQLIVVSRDLMAEQDELDDSVDDLATTTESLTRWWYSLIKETPSSKADESVL